MFGSTSAVITGLKKYTWYVVWVTASTAKGDGGHRSNKNRARTLEDGERAYAAGALASRNSHSM